MYLKVHQAIAETLRAEGTETVFCVAGYGNLDLVVDLSDRLDVNLVTARHEQGAVAMADGYARAKGSPAVCAVTQGPGLTNAATALTTACRKGSPVLLFAGESPLGDPQDVQSLNQRAFGEILGAKVITVQSPNGVWEDLRVAFRHLRLGLGPVLLSAPIDIQIQEVEIMRPTPKTSELPPYSAQRVRPDPDRVVRVAQILSQSVRPIILAGWGSYLSNARDEIVQLAQRLGALLATTVQAKDLFGDHPNCIGVAGGLGTKDASALFGEADCILSLGASLNRFTTKFGGLFSQAKVIQIGLDPSHMADFEQVDLAVVGDIRTTLETLADALEPARPQSGTSEWVQKAMNLNGREQKPGQPYVVATDGLDPNFLMSELDAILPRERSVTVDGGHFLVFPTAGLAVPDPRGFLFSQDFASIGLGVPMAIGAALGNPKRHSVAVVGDGGFTMSMQEVETAARHGIPLTVVVMNDRAYGGELRQLEALNISHSRAVEFENPSFAQVAAAFGAVGITLNTHDDVTKLKATFVNPTQPVVIDAKITRRVKHDWIRELTTEAPWREQLPQQNP